MSFTSMPPIARPVALTAAILAVMIVAAPVAAKEFVEARLDAPIAMGTPGGTRIVVGMTVTVSDRDGIHPVIGTPVYLTLLGKDGASTRAAGAADTVDGHYTFRIEIPAGGARGLEVGIHGTSDLPIMLAGPDPLAFGGITPATAQLAPLLAPPPTPLPSAAAASAPAVVPAAPGPAAAPAGGVAPAPLLLVVVPLGAIAAGLVLVLAVRLVRARRQPVVRDAP